MAGEFFYPYKGHTDEVATEHNQTALEQFLNQDQADQDDFLYFNTLKDDWDTDMDTTPPVVGDRLEFLGNQETELSQTLWSASSNVPHWSTYVLSNIHNGVLGDPPWISDGPNLGNGTWVIVDTGQPVEITKIRVLQEQATRYSDVLTLHHSSDGLTWTLIGTFTGLVGDAYLTFNPTTSRFWRVTENSTVNGTHTWRIFEWQMFMSIDMWGPATNDHGALEGLLDDDHPQYLLQILYENSLEGQWDTDMDTSPPNIGDHLEYTGIQNSVLSRVGWVASSNGNKIGYPVANIIDSNTSTRWRSDGYMNAATDHWISVDCGTPVTPNRIVIDQHDGGYAETMTVYHSDDNINWVQSAPQFTGLGSSSTVNLDFILGEPYRYWKVEENGVRLIEWAVFEIYLEQNIPMWEPGNPNLSTAMTTKGDLLTYDTADTRLPIGTDTHVLTADSAQAEGMAWAVIPTQHTKYTDAEAVTAVSTDDAYVLHDGDAMTGTHDYTAAEVLLPLKSDTGDPTGVEGLIYVNTFDNAVRVYADGAWRDLATW